MTLPSSQSREQGALSFKTQENNPRCYEIADFLPTNFPEELKIFACQHLFDHAAKTNQARYPWSQNIVTVGLLKRIHGRWSCLPLAWRFYLRKKTLTERTVRMGRRAVALQSKFTQAIEMLVRIAELFREGPMLVLTDSWFGNNGLLRPLRRALGERAHLLSRLRVTATLYAPPAAADLGTGHRLYHSTVRQAAHGDRGLSGVFAQDPQASGARRPGLSHTLCQDLLGRLGDHRPYAQRGRDHRVLRRTLEDRDLPAMLPP